MTAKKIKNRNEVIRQNYTIPLANQGYRENQAMGKFRMWKNSDVGKPDCWKHLAVGKTKL